MKKIFNLMIIAVYEFKLNLKIFSVNVFICSLLFGVMLSIAGLAFNMPEKIEEEMLNSEMGQIQISNIDYSDLDYVRELPLKIYAIGYDSDWSMFQGCLNDEQKSVNLQSDIDNSLNLAYYTDSGTGVPFEINKNLVSGEKWGETDNEVKDVSPLWLEDWFAQEMNLDIGDSITLSNAECSIDFWVKGIYKDTAGELASSYVSLNMYGKLLCEEERNIILFAQCNSSPIKFLEIVHELKDNYYIVESYEENVYAMFLLIVFVWVCTLLILALMINVVVDFNHIYFAARQQFWAINKALGLQDTGRKFICCVISGMIVVLSYAIGVIISTYLSNYFTEYIKTLFDFNSLNLKMSMSNLVVTFIGSLLLTIGVLWSKKIQLNEDIKG